MRGRLCQITVGEGWELARARPSEPLAARGVYGYRGSALELGRPRRRLELPTGEVTVFLALDQRIRIDDPARPGPRTYTSLINGARSHASVGEHGGRLRGVEVAMAPWAAHELFGMPMDELAAGTVELENVLGRRAELLLERLDAAAGRDGRFSVLDAELRSLAGRRAGSDPQVREAWRSLVATGGAGAITRLADGVGWSRRRLDRRFRQQISLPPKVLARALRLRRAARLLTEGTPAAVTAVRSGFCDQAHLSAEFVRMTGLTPGRFLAERAVPAPGPRAVDRLEHPVTSVVLAS